MPDVRAPIARCGDRIAAAEVTLFLLSWRQPRDHVGADGVDHARNDNGTSDLPRVSIRCAERGAGLSEAAMPAFEPAFRKMPAPGGVIIASWSSRG
jgi:hypothetical protein